MSLGGPDQLLRLINEFKARPSLWDSHQENYLKNISQRRTALHEIAAIFDTSTAEIDKRWRSLRTMYRLKLKKVIEEEKAGRTAHIQWWAFEHIDAFLRRILVKEDETAKAQDLTDEVIEIPGTSDTANDEFGSTADYSYSGGFDGSQFGSSVLQDSTNSVDESYDNTYDTSYNEACGPPSAKRKRPSKPAAQPEASRVGRNHSSSEENLSDNYQAFSELVVAQLKSLPPNRAAILQLKIQTLLSKAIVGSEEDEDGTEEEALGDEDSEMNIEATVKSDVEADTELGEKSPRRARSEDYPSRAETQVETTTTTTMVTTIAKKKSLRQDGATENKENQQVVLDNVYIAFSKCIVSQLKYLPAPVAMKTQNRIQKVISDEIVRFHNTRTSSGHTDTKAEDTPVNSPPAVQIKEEPEDSCED